MNRLSWKQNYKKYSNNKLKRLKSRLSEGNSLQRSPLQIKNRCDTK
jgi:outer membrane biogenesis lipoprotein LolB